MLDYAKHGTAVRCSSFFFALFKCVIQFLLFSFSILSLLLRMQICNSNSGSGRR